MCDQRESYGMTGPEIGSPTESDPSAITVIVPTYSRSAYLRLCMHYLEDPTVARSAL
jgi:hypothetical protein